MEKLPRTSPSVRRESPEYTPKRNLVPQRPMTPLQMIKEEGNKEHQRNQSTPIRWNPFDVKAEALYLPACSPSVFATFQRNKVDNGTFRWSIEHLSVLYPADIDETSVPDTWVDAEQEVKAQKAIDTFFSQNSIVPSPWSSSPKEGRGDVKSRRRACISSIFQNVQSNEVSTQTMLSIPPNIDLSKILGNFFTYDDSEDKNSRENSREEIDLSTSSLRRKLFANDDECTSPCRIENKNLHFAQRMSTPTVHMRSVHSTPASDILSSSPITPPNCSDSCNILSSPPVSPISASPFAGNRLKLFDNRPEAKPGISNFQRGSSPSPNKADDTTTEIAMSFCVDSQDTNPFPSSYGSERQDTGYGTSCLSSQNMTGSMFNYGPVSRIIPATDDGFTATDRSERQNIGYGTHSGCQSSQNMTGSMFNYVPVSKIIPATDDGFTATDRSERQDTGYSGCQSSQNMTNSMFNYGPASKSTDDGSEPQDTGYSTLSSQNLTTSSMFSYGPVSRITPVTELMEECELSNSTCDMSYRSDSRADMEFAKAQSLTAQPAACNFKTYPWVPTCCSTPAKCNHS